MSHHHQNSFGPAHTLSLPHNPLLFAYSSTVPKVNIAYQVAHFSKHAIWESQNRGPLETSGIYWDLGVLRNSHVSFEEGMP